MFTLIELLGIVVAAAASIAISALWYAPPLFGTVWMRELGLTEEKMKSMTTTPAQAIGIAIALSLVYTILIHALFAWTGIRTVGQAVLLSVLCCLTFYVIPLFIHDVFENAPKKVWAIYAAHELVLAIVVSFIVSWSILY